MIKYKVILDSFEELTNGISNIKELLELNFETGNPGLSDEQKTLDLFNELMLKLNRLQIHLTKIYNMKNDKQIEEYLYADVNL